MAKKSTKKKTIAPAAKKPAKNAKQSMAKGAAASKRRPPKPTKSAPRAAATVRAAMSARVVVKPAVAAKRESTETQRSMTKSPPAEVASNGADAGRIVVENVNVPGYTTRVDAEMYQIMKTALLKALPQRPPGLTQSEMFIAVVRHLPESHFPGGAKAGWWAKTVQLDLEAKGVVARQSTKPLRWHRAT